MSRWFRGRTQWNGNLSRWNLSHINWEKPTELQRLEKKEIVIVAKDVDGKDEAQGTCRVSSTTSIETIPKNMVIVGNFKVWEE